MSKNSCHSLSGAMSCKQAGLFTAAAQWGRAAHGWVDLAQLLVLCCACCVPPAGWLLTLQFCTPLSVQPTPALHAQSTHLHPVVRSSCCSTAPDACLQHTLHYITLHSSIT